MMKMNESLKSQLVHLISLLIAASALFYSTWRTEQTEINTNVRTASFEVLRELSKLQLIVDYAYYDNDLNKGNPITGWGRIALIHDLSHVISDDVNNYSNQLKDDWSEHWKTMHSSLESNKILTSSIVTTRQSVLDTLAQLK